MLCCKLDLGQVGCTCLVVKTNTAFWSPSFIYYFKRRHCNTVNIKLEQ